MGNSSPPLTEDELPELPENWKWSRVGELVDQTRGICYGIVQPGKHTPSGVPMVNSNDVNNGRVADQIDFRVSATLHSKFKRSTIRGGEILLTLVGANFGRVAIAPERLAGFNCSRAVGILPVRENTGYVMYCLRSPLTRHYLDTWANTTAQPTFNLKEAANLPVPLPPLPEQKAIAHILGSLDDKIELNRKMNATLEAMAQALFKSWFVDFDPVIDNALRAGNPIPDELAHRAEIRKKALAGGTANEDAAKDFPAAFQATEALGWIPEGWEERKIGDIFELKGGHSFKSNDYVEDGQYGVVTIKNVQDGSFVQNCTNSITLLPKKMKPHCILKAGEILLSLTGNVGRVCMVSDGTYVLNQRVSKIVGNDDIPEAFSYFFFRQQPLYERMLTIAKGTAQQNLSPIETAKLEQLMPGNELIKSLSTVLTPFFNKMVANTSESQSLTKLRDTLLPKLISGELRVSEAKQLTEEALV